MEEAIVSAVAQSTREVFTSMVSIDLDGEPLVRGDDAIAPCRVMAMVGLAGKSMGILSVHCSPQMAATITSNMLGMEFTEIGDEVRDALGEVANMIAGSFKTKMSKTGELFDLSVPTVIVGESYTTRTLTNAPTVVLEFPNSAGHVFVKLIYKS